MNYYLLIYPILSLACFFTVFFYPQAAIILLFISPLVLLTYFEGVDRTRKTDAISGAIFLLSALIDPLQTLYYLPMVLIPIIILTESRKRSPDKTYLAPLVAPLPLVITAAILIVFAPEMRELLNNAMLNFINVLTAPLASSPDRFSDMGVISLMIADKNLSAKYLTYMLPCIIFTVLSICVFVVDRVRPKIAPNGVAVIRDFRLPDKFVWVLIVGGFFILVNNEYVKFFSINIIVIFGILYFFQGVQLMAILFDRVKIGGIFRGLIYVFLFTEPPVIVSLALMGLFSIWFRPKWMLRQEDQKVERRNG